MVVNLENQRVWDYIVKTVCDNLGHKVEIKSKTEKGTQVSILFKK